MKKVKFVLCLLLPILLVILLVYVVINTSFTNITCKSQYGECSALIAERLKEIGNCNYFECKKDIDIVLSDAWIVDKYTQQIKLPLKIEVNIVERKPAYSLKTITGDVIVQTDSNGMVLNYKDSTNLPCLTIEDELPKLGEKVPDETLFALQLIYGTSKIQGVKSAYLADNVLTVDITEGKKVLFPLSGNRDFILGALTLILNELKKDGLGTRIEGVDRISAIDLRYKNPILR